MSASDFGKKTKERNSNYIVHYKDTYDDNGNTVVGLTMIINVRSHHQWKEIPIQRVNRENSSDIPDYAGPD